ncbi:unnamed protein product [Choristocarpus tenellus]
MNPKKSEGGVGSTPLHAPGVQEVKEPVKEIGVTKGADAVMNPKKSEGGVGSTPLHAPGVQEVKEPVKEIGVAKGADAVMDPKQSEGGVGSTPLHAPGVQEVKEPVKEIGATKGADAVMDPKKSEGGVGSTPLHATGVQEVKEPVKKIGVTKGADAVMDPKRVPLEKGSEKPAVRVIAVERETTVDATEVMAEAAVSAAADTTAEWTAEWATEAVSEMSVKASRTEAAAVAHPVMPLRPAPLKRKCDEVASAVPMTNCCKERRVSGQQAVAGAACKVVDTRAEGTAPAAPGAEAWEEATGQGSLRVTTGVSQESREGQEEAVGRTGTGFSQVDIKATQAAGAGQAGRAARGAGEVVTTSPIASAAPPGVGLPTTADKASGQVIPKPKEGVLETGSEDTELSSRQPKSRHLIACEKPERQFENPLDGYMALVGQMNKVQGFNMDQLTSIMKAVRDVEVRFLFRLESWDIGIMGNLPWALVL